MKSFFQKSLLFGSTLVLVGALVGNAVYAHVVVKPAEVPTASYQTFTVSVPNERDAPTTKVKLEIPEGVSSVTPTVKNGWTITTTKTKDKTADVKTITWKNGSIDVGLRDEFTFSAKTADQPVELHWKAYQTYQDGIVVSWDGEDDDDHEGTVGPFSVTQVVDQDDNMDAEKINKAILQSKDTARYSLYMASFSLVVGLVVIYFSTKRNS